MSALEGVWVVWTYGVGEPSILSIHADELEGRREADPGYHCSFIPFGAEVYATLYPKSVKV